MKAKKSDESDEGLAIGEPLPDVVVKSETGDEINVKTLSEGRSGVVLFLVPKADTRKWPKLILPCDNMPDFSLTLFLTTRMT